MKKYVFFIASCIMCIFIGLCKISAKDISLNDIVDNLKETTSYTSNLIEGHFVNIKNASDNLNITYGTNWDDRENYTCNLKFTYKDQVLEYQKDNGESDSCAMRNTEWFTDILRVVGRLLKVDETELINWFKDVKASELEKLTMENNGMKVEVKDVNVSSSVFRYFLKFEIDFKNFNYNNKLCFCPVTSLNENRNITNYVTGDMTCADAKKKYCQEKEVCTCPANKLNAYEDLSSKMQTDNINCNEAQKKYCQEKDVCTCPADKLNAYEDLSSKMQTDNINCNEAQKKYCQEKVYQNPKTRDTNIITFLILAIITFSVSCYSFLKIFKTK